MYPNQLKAHLAQDRPICGCMIQGYMPALAEIAGLAGFDFLFLDAEHSSLSVTECENMVRAAEARGIVPLVRVPNCKADTILRYLDCGAMGVILPGIANAEEAKRAVQAAKYYPMGERGLNGVRASDYGMAKPLSEYTADANRETMVIPIIENREAIDNLDEILAVEGIDGMILGASDLSQSLGVPGQGKHPLVLAAKKRFIEAGQASGKPFGTVVRAGESIDAYLAEGMKILMVNAYALFGSAAKGFVQNFCNNQ